MIQISRYLMNVPLNLHWTSTTAAIDVSFPRLLFATQRYAPLSTRLALVIANCFFSAEKLILELLLMSDPSLVHDRVGNGYPVALQCNVTFSPSVFVTLLGWVVISLLSTIVKQLQWTLATLTISANIFLNSTIQWLFMFTADTAEPIEMTCKTKMTVFSRLLSSLSTE